MSGSLEGLVAVMDCYLSFGLVCKFWKCLPFNRVLLLKANKDSWKLILSTLWLIFVAGDQGLWVEPEFQRVDSNVLSHAG